MVVDGCSPRALSLHVFMPGRLSVTYQGDSWSPEPTMGSENLLLSPWVFLSRTRFSDPQLGGDRKSLTVLSTFASHGSSSFSYHRTTAVTKHYQRSYTLSQQPERHTGFLECPSHEGPVSNLQVQIWQWGGGSQVLEHSSAVECWPTMYEV